MAVSAGMLSRSLVQAQAPGAPRNAPAATPKFTPLRRNVGTFTLRGGTIGWLVNSQAVAAVDTQFGDTAAIFAEQLAGRHGRSFDVVVNTHHHGDHTGGNPTLRPMAKTIVAHDHVPELMKARATQDKKELNPVAVPDSTFARTWKMDLGDEAVSAKYFGPGHTRGDIVVLFEKANVAHLGDLLFNRIYPVIDRPGGGRIKGWIQVLENVAKEYPADTIFVFGHAGEKYPVTGSRADLLTFRNYLSGLLDYTQKQIKAGKKKEEVVALENLPGFPEYHTPLPNRLGGNLGVAYDELTSQAG